MGDWTDDPTVISAIRDFDVALALWNQVSPEDGILTATSSEAQRIAYVRMRAADLAYVLARDMVIYRVKSDFSFD